jgi:hypothetical protein
MTGSELSTAIWHKSSHSSSQAEECVEVARVARVTAVRDSKDPNGPILTFSNTEWLGLLETIKTDRPKSST